jgi:hypothetical protein
MASEGPRNGENAMIDQQRKLTTPLLEGIQHEQRSDFELWSDRPGRTATSAAAPRRRREGSAKTFTRVRSRNVLVVIC